MTEMMNNATRELINEDRLVSFLQGFADCWFSEDRALIDEIQYVGRIVSSADTYRLVAERGVSEVVDLFHQQRLAYRLMEYSKEELFTKSAHAYEAAAKKVLWMNAMCKQYTHQPFITAWVNLQDTEDQRAIAGAFVDTIRSYVSGR